MIAVLLLLYNKILQKQSNGGYFQRLLNHLQGKFVPNNHINTTLTGCFVIDIGF